MGRLRVATALLSNQIFAGYPTKKGDGFRGHRHDVTSDVLKAVIDHIGDGKTVVVLADGVPTYEISVAKVPSKQVSK